MKTAYITVIATSLTLSGCLTTANLIKHPLQVNTDSPYAPESEKKADGIGVVNYLNEGADFVTNARREDAYKQAFDACSGPYEILAENASYTDPMYLSRISGNTVTTTGYSSEYRYIYFTCKPK